MNTGARLRALFFSLCLTSFRARAAPRVSCLRSTLGTDGQTHVSFLREDAAGARLLYLTRWAEDARLVACEINQHPSVTEGYGLSCDGSESPGEEEPTRYNISALLSRDAPGCALPEFPQRATGVEESRGRRKRSWMFPGTLWCGSGSRAAGYEQLGMFERADRCCREHDHCSRVIPAFTVNYGVFNPNFYTVSHCECDQRFRQCLLGMNDSVSNMVGYSFFSILKVPCFKLKQLKRCTQMYWWGMCKVAKKAPYAVFKSPLPYNSSDVSGQYKSLTNSEEQRFTESHMLNHRRKTKQRCGVRDPTRGDTFHHRTKGRGCKRHQQISGPGPSQVSTTPRTQTTTQSTNSQTQALVKQRVGKNKSMRNRLTQKSNNLRKGLTSSAPQTPTTTPSPVPPLTQRIKPQPKTLVKEGTKRLRSKNKFSKHRICCGSNIPVRNDSSQFYCKNCLKQDTASDMTSFTLGKINTKALTVNGTKNKKAHIKKTTGQFNQDTSGTVWGTAVFPTPIVTKQMTTASLYNNVQSQTWLGSRRNHTSQQSSGGTAAGNVRQGKRPLCNNKWRNVTDNQLQCRSLKHLDECKFKIPPLEKKYNLHNMESKTAYHCDCISR